MCGRINVSDFPPVQRLMDFLGMPIYPNQAKRYNITPGSSVPIIIDNNFDSVEWGIEFNQFKHPNTRLETVMSKKPIQEMMLSQRCVIPINRYYEWPSGSRKKLRSEKTRYCIHSSEEVMLLGGIYSLKNKVKQFNILTIESNEQMGKFHHRMPLIIQPADFEDWVMSNDLDNVFELSLKKKDPLLIYECDEFVDNGKNEGEKCIAPKKERQMKLF